MIERAEKQIILARHARRLLNFVDDTPVVPGDARQAYDHELEARQVLEDAENDLRAWQLNVEPIAIAGEQETRANGVSAEQASVANGADTESMVNESASSKKQLEEPQASMGESQTAAIAS